MRFTAQDIPRLDDKIVLITGANSGLGLESAKALAARGARVLVAARSADKCEHAMREIRKDDAAARLEPLLLDLADLASVRAAAAEVMARYARLDVLMNNAGVMAVPYARTKDGFELQFGTNHLGHFALTGLLFELLRKTAGARVVNVSSSAHKMGKLRFDDPHWERSYGKWSAYGMSKIANLLFTYELARRCTAQGIAIKSVAAHPGYAATNLQYRGPQLAQSAFGERLFRWINPLLGQPAAMGALPQLYAAVAPDVQSGDYIGPGGFKETRGYPKKVQSIARSHDLQTMQKLWTLSEQLTGVRFAALDTRAVATA
jgi:NAD(P)-dependent dehydrogenase (short-subunit alcohol dehydrogenase family)